MKKLTLIVVLLGLLIGCSKQDKEQNLVGDKKNDIKVYKEGEHVALYDFISLLLPDSNSKEPYIDLSLVYKSNLVKKTGDERLINIMLNGSPDTINTWKVFSKDNHNDSLKWDRVFIGIRYKEIGNKLDCQKYISIDSMLNKQNFSSKLLKQDWDCRKGIGENLYEVSFPCKRLFLMSIHYDSQEWMSNTWLDKYSSKGGYCEIIIMLKN